MKIKTIKVKVFTFDELDERIQRQVKQRLLSFFKDHVNENTLFFSNGQFYSEQSLNFMGLKNIVELEK